MKTVADLRENVSAILTGIDLDQLPDLYGSFERAVATTIQKADILEASGREPIMLYDGVFDYLAPDTIFGGALIDIRPQGRNRQEWDDVEKMPLARFDQTKFYTPSGYKVTFEDRRGVLSMRIAQSFAQQAITLDSMTDTDGWAFASNGIDDGTDVAADTTVFYQQPASLRFNLWAGGSLTTLTKTLDNAIDLSEYTGVGVGFLAIYMPSTTPITSVALRIGSSENDFYQVTATEGFLGAFVEDEFFLIPFDLSDGSASGVPDMTAVNYVQVIINYNGTAVPNVRLGDVSIALPSPHEVLFYSPAVFISGTSDPAAEINNDEDSILFRTAAYNIYVQEAAREIAKNQGGNMSSSLIQSIDLVLEGDGGKKLGLYQKFRGSNPSEELRQVGSYYDSRFGR